MEESNEIYEKVVLILEEGVKPLEQLYIERGVKFTVGDVATIAGVFSTLHNKLINYYKELKEAEHDALVRIRQEAKQHMPDGWEGKQ